MYKKRSLATAENADALSSTPETTSSTAFNNIVSQDNDIVNSNPIVQKMINSLSEEDKKRIFLQNRYKRYFKLYNGDVNAVLEEFVADVMSGMNDYTANYIDIVTDYWYNGKDIDKYNPAEYNKLIDTGGHNASVLESIGLGNDYSLSGSFGDIPYREYMQLRNYIMQKNNSADALPSTDCKEIGDKE